MRLQRIMEEMRTAFGQSARIIGIKEFVIDDIPFYPVDVCSSQYHKYADCADSLTFIVIFEGCRSLMTYNFKRWRMAV